MHASFLSKMHLHWSVFHDFEKGNFAEAVAEKINPKRPGKSTCLLHTQMYTGCNGCQIKRIRMVTKQFKATGKHSRIFCFDSTLSQLPQLNSLFQSPGLLFIIMFYFTNSIWKKNTISISQE